MTGSLQLKGGRRISTMACHTEGSPIRERDCSGNVPSPFRFSLWFSSADFMCLRENPAYRIPGFILR